MHGTHRDEDGRAYFEFATQYLDEVHRVLERYGHADQVDVGESPQAMGEPCQNCGNIAGAVCPSVCPNCGFRDVSPCPTCGEEISRQSYLRYGDSLFRCPNCRSRVALRFNEPMFLTDGRYNQPLVVVEVVEVPAG
jgi:DNA-directed RNA polymerase subunit RPC12/RpoP